MVSPARFGIGLWKMDLLSFHEESCTKFNIVPNNDRYTITIIIIQ